MRGDRQQRLDADLGLRHREPGKQHGELLAAVAGEQPSGSELLGPAGDGLTQQSVTGLMAMGVVVGLEVVHVHHRDAQGRAISRLFAHARDSS